MGIKTTIQCISNAWFSVRGASWAVSWNTWSYIDMLHSLLTYYYSYWSSLTRRICNVHSFNTQQFCKLEMICVQLGFSWQNHFVRYRWVLFSCTCSAHLRVVSNLLDCKEKQKFHHLKCVCQNTPSTFVALDSLFVYAKFLMRQFTTSERQFDLNPDKICGYLEVRSKMHRFKVARSHYCMLLP